MKLTKAWTVALDDYVIDLAWSPRGHLLAAGSAAGPVSLFTARGEAGPVLPGHAPGTNCLAFQPDGPLLATGGQDGAVRLWDTGSGQAAGVAELGPAWVDHLAWRPAGAQPSVLAAAAGREFYFLRRDAAVAHHFRPAPKTITALAWQPAGGCVAVACFGGVCLWDADDFVAQKELPYGNSIHALTWSPDGKWLVSGNQDTSVHLWIPEEDQELHMSGYESKVQHLGFDRTSRWLATSGGSEGCVWDCSGAGPEGRDPVMLPHGVPVGPMAFQHTHGLLATSDAQGNVVLWSPERPQPLRARVQAPHAATKLCWSPDDRYLAIGTPPGTIYVLECEV